jgi:hypothetical protein
MSRPQLHLIAVDKSVDIKVDLGDGSSTPTAGFSGYETVPRIRKKGMTAFVGTPPFAQDVPVFLDGYRENRSIQREHDLLLSLGGSSVFWAYGPIDRPGLRYVFGDEPEFGETIKAEDGTLLRRAITLKLEEWVPTDQAGQRVGPKVGVGQGVPLSYTTVQGDTLEKVAFKVFDHEWRRWKEIGQKNGRSDPHKLLPPGLELKL